MLYLYVMKNILTTFLALTLMAVACTKPEPEPQPQPEPEPVVPVPQPEPEPEPEPQPKPQPELPKADLLDIEFLADGTAVDRSPKGMKVETLPGARLTTYSNTLFGRQVAHFSNDLGTTVSNSYYKIDYSSDASFKNALADGHSWEAVVRIDESPVGLGEIKFFTATQSGGTGFLISNQSRGNHFSFIPNTGSWNWAESSTVPQVGRYYHLVGIFDNDNGVSQIYVDGVLQGSVSNSSKTFQHANSSYQFIALGGDPGKGGCTNAWNGDVVLARIYDKVLSSDEVASLAASLPLDGQVPSVPQIQDLQFLGTAHVNAGWKYNIFASGFQSGDSITLSGRQDYTPSVSVSSDHLSMTIPQDLKEGSYTIILKRGSTEYPLGNVNFYLTSSAKPITTKVVAHRGAHKNTGLPQNSIASLRADAPLGIYASELDVWITKDDVVVVNHDANYPSDNHVIQDSNYSDLAGVKLGNGEGAPTLEAFIHNAKELGIRLVIEVKRQKACSDGSFSAERNNERVVDAAVALVKKYDYTAMCDWIGFDMSSCKRIAAALPGACVQYLNGDLSPAQCQYNGLSGIDYKNSVLIDHIPWIESAHSLGMVVNVWTVDASSEMLDWIGRGVDFITTNQPELCQEIVSRKFIEE